MPGPDRSQAQPGPPPQNHWTRHRARTGASTRAATHPNGEDGGLHSAGALADPLDCELEQIRERLAERGRAIADLQARLAERDGALRSLLDTKIAHEHQIDHLGRLIEEIQASRSWRLTRPLRVASKLRRALAHPRTHGKRALLRLLRTGYAHFPGSLALKGRVRRQLKSLLGEVLSEDAARTPRSNFRGDQFSASSASGLALGAGHAERRPLAPDLQALAASATPEGAAIFSLELAVAEAHRAAETDPSRGAHPVGPAALLAALASPPGRTSQNAGGTSDGALRARTLCDQLAEAALRAHLAADPAHRRRLDFARPHAPKVSVIAVLWGRAELTLACLESLRRSECVSQLELIVVDNASQDDTPALLATLRGVRVLRNHENRGYLRAVNQALEVARGEHVLLLNNDAQVFPHSIGCASRALDREPDVGAVGGRIVLLDGSLQEAGSIVWNDGSCLGYARGAHPDDPRVLHRRDVDYCSGAFLMLRRALFREIGGFDERYAPAYYEEADLCMELRARGHRVLYEPDALILHYEFASSARREDAIALQRRNRAAFVDKHRAALAHHFAPAPGNVLRARARASDPPGNAGRAAVRERERILVLDDRVPHRGLGQGLPRANDLLRRLCALGFEVTHYATTLPDEHWRALFADVPREIELIHGWGVARLAEFLRERRGHYSRLIVSRPHNMGFVRALLGADPTLLDGVEIVYDAEAIFALRDAERERARGRGVKPDELEALVREEIELADDAARITAVSEREAAQFRLRTNRPVHVLGHRIEPRPGERPHALRSGLLFVGPLVDDDTPNVDGIAWFVEEVWPTLCRSLPEDAKLHLVGATGATQVKAIQAYHGRRVIVHGFVPDVSSLYESCRVFIVPTRFAGGIPYKAHEAAARGLPIVASALIGEQLGWRDGHELRVGGDAARFAEHCLRLHEDAGEWQRVREAALRRLALECSPRRFDEGVSQMLGLAPALAAPPKHEPGVATRGARGRSNDPAPDADAGRTPAGTWSAP